MTMMMMMMMMINEALKGLKLEVCYLILFKQLI